MTWMKAVEILSYLAVILFAVTLFVPPRSVGCSGNTVVPYSDMNKTIRDQMRKRTFLNQMMSKLMETITFPRNVSASNSSHRATFSPDKINMMSKLGQVSDNTTSTDTYTVDKGTFSLSSLNPPNLVYSQSEEKNVLTFKFKPKTVRSKTLVNRINLWLYVWTKDSKDKVPTFPSLSVLSSSPSPTTRNLEDDEPRDRRNGKRIKIRVFLSNLNGSRGLRIAELKTRIDGSTWGKLGLPVSLINTLAESNSNNTLRLRIECKRCSGKTQVVMPSNAASKRCRQRQGMKKKKKDDRMRRWRKHCTRAGNTDEKLFPFIVIEEKSKTSPGRVKRDSRVERCTPNRACSNEVTTGVEADLRSVPPSNLTSKDQHPCRLVKTYVEFSDLNLKNAIVYPSGFEYATCIRSSGDTTATDIDKKLAGLSNFISERIRFNDRGASRQHSETSQTQKRPRHTSHHPNTQLQQQQYSYQPRSGKHCWCIHKRNRLKQPEVCRPTETRNLVIFYLTGEHKMAQTQLAGIVVTGCVCHSH